MNEDKVNKGALIISVFSLIVATLSVFFTYKSNNLIVQTEKLNKEPDIRFGLDFVFSDDNAYAFIGNLGSVDALSVTIQFVQWRYDEKTESINKGIKGDNFWVIDRLAPMSKLEKSFFVSSFWLDASFRDIKSILNKQGSLGKKVKGKSENLENFGLIDIKVGDCDLYWSMIQSNEKKVNLGLFSIPISSLLPIQLTHPCLDSNDAIEARIVYVRESDSKVYLKRAFYFFDESDENWIPEGRNLNRRQERVLKKLLSINLKKSLDVYFSGGDKLHGGPVRIEN